MVTITYDTLNELTHAVAHHLAGATGLPFDNDPRFKLTELNDVLTEYLQRYGVQFEEGEGVEWESYPGMDTFQMRIRLGNAAMDTPDDVAGTISDIALRIAAGRRDGLIRDDNGNTVGSFAFRTEA